MAMMLVMPFVSSAATLTRELEKGMSGSDVSTLQAFLAQDVTIYPQGLVTGYFGFLTKSAVSNFQDRNGIANVGRVGPVTMVAINNQMNGGTVSNPTNDTAPVIMNVNTNTGTNNTSISWATNEPSKGLIYYSNVPLTTYENTNSVTVSGYTAMTDTNFNINHNVSITGLQANTTYYYMVYTTDQSGYVSVTWPATFRTI